MANFGHVERITRSVGGKEITFRSLLEYRDCVYLQVLKEGGEIQEWWYESQDWLFTFQHGRLNNTKQYLPDLPYFTMTARMKSLNVKATFLR